MIWIQLQTLTNLPKRDFQLNKESKNSRERFFHISNTIIELRDFEEDLCTVGNQFCQGTQVRYGFKRFLSVLQTFGSHFVQRSIPNHVLKTEFFSSSILTLSWVTNKNLVTVRKIAVALFYHIQFYCNCSRHKLVFFIKLQLKLVQSNP